MIKLPIAALVVVIALLGGFYGGYKIGGNGSTASAAGTSNTLRTGNTTFGGGGRGFAACPSTSASPSASGSIARRATSGTITNLTSNTITVHDVRCNTNVTVTFSPTVIVRKTVVGQTTDLQENETITVTGTMQPDGTIKANSINIVPAGSTGGGGFGGFGGFGGLGAASTPAGG